MAVVINGDGTITGISIGGLPDGIVDAGTLATNSVDSAELIDGAVDNSHLADDAVDSDELAAGAVDTAHIGDDQVTYAKIQNVSATNLILGRDSASAGVIEEISPASLRTMINVEDGADVTDATNVTAAGALMDSECAGLAAVKATTGTFLTADQTKLDAIEASADVTDATNVTAAGALMDSELAGIAAVKATTGTFLSADESKLDAIEASADVTDATNVGTVVNGKQTIWIPAAAITPTSSNGCATRTQVETTAGRPDMDVLDFDASADEHAQFSVAFPKSWNLGTVTFQAFWTSTATDTDGVAWGLQGVAMNDNETIDVVYGTAIVVTDDAQSAAEELYVTAESSAITIAGTPADDDLCYFRVLRDVSDGNDDMTEDARLIGIKLFFTTDALNDA